MNIFQCVTSKATDCMGATDSKVAIHKDLNPFLVNVPILNLLKIPENQSFSVVFREHWPELY